MAELNDKQCCECQINKLVALRLLARHIGFITPWGNNINTPEDKKAEYIAYAITGILDPDSDVIQKSACVLLLDIFIPDWRDKADKEFIGNAITRDDKSVLQWKRDVFTLKGNQCEECGSKERLEVHHKIRWVDSPFLRVDPLNGKILCYDCHKDVHSLN